MPASQRNDSSGGSANQDSGACNHDEAESRAETDPGLLEFGDVSGAKLLLARVGHQISGLIRIGVGLLEHKGNLFSIISFRSWQLASGESPIGRRRGRNSLTLEVLVEKVQHVE